MVDELNENDELIERVARSLRPLPPSDPRAKARILATARAHRAAAPTRLTLVLEWMREPAFSVASVGALAAAALVIGFVANGAIMRLNDAATVDAPRVANTPVVPAANTSEAVRQVPVPIVFDAAGARRVSIVGDFNDWSESAAPMTRFGSNGPWTATIKVTPGRHLYAFMVDGKLVVDPRAPRAHDADYGDDASVLMVNTP
jgi:hypothetical protein